MGISTCLSTTLDGGVLVAIEVQPKASTQGIIGFNAWRNRISVAVKAEAKKWPSEPSRPSCDVQNT
jgi:uncharacterized protein YggU (UPF0235/DUF167 family)